MDLQGNGLAGECFGEECGFQTARVFPSWLEDEERGEKARKGLLAEIRFSDSTLSISFFVISDDFLKGRNCIKMKMYCIKKLLNILIIQ